MPIERIGLDNDMKKKYIYIKMVLTLGIENAKKVYLMDWILHLLIPQQDS